MEFYCVPPLHAQTKWNYWTKHQSSIILGFDYQIYGFTDCIFPGKKNVLFKITDSIVNFDFVIY